MISIYKASACIIHETIFSELKNVSSSENLLHLLLLSAIHALAHIKEPRVHITALKMSPTKVINKNGNAEEKKYTHNPAPKAAFPF